MLTVLVRDDAVAAPDPRASQAEVEEQREQGAVLGGEALQDDAVAQLVRILWCQDDLGVPGRRFLISVIEGIGGPVARGGLRQLLGHWDPNVRGESAAGLGRSRAKEAMPALLGLLDDEAVYLTRVSTDPHAEDPILVRDKAVEALEAITGTVRGKGEPARERARAWRSWMEGHLQDAR